MSPTVRRVPVLDDLNREFWTAGRDDVLRLRRCANCQLWLHPPRPVCPKCWGRDVAWEATNGRGSLYSFTVNHKAWSPDLPVPYVIGMVELEEQVGLRLTSNIVHCGTDDLVLGMPLRVVFEQQGDIFVPLFEPDVLGVRPTTVAP
jgi:uncharacterized OB-fold protein